MLCFEEYHIILCSFPAALHYQECGFKEYGVIDNTLVSKTRNSSLSLDTPAMIWVGGDDWWCHVRL